MVPELQPYQMNDLLFYFLHDKKGPAENKSSVGDSSAQQNGSASDRIQPAMSVPFVECGR